MAEHTSNLEVVQKIKVKLRKSNITCDELASLLNTADKTSYQQEDVIRGFMKLYSYTDDILKLLTTGSEF